MEDVLRLLEGGGGVMGLECLGSPWDKTVQAVEARHLSLLSVLRSQDRGGQE